MRSPRERAVWATVAVLLVAGAAAAWWTADRWLPHAGPWAEQAWSRMTRPGPETLSKDKGGPGATGRNSSGSNAQAGGASTPAVQPRKCVRDGRITYTDQPCPPGSQEQGVDGGAITSLPAQR